MLSSYPSKYRRKTSVCHKLTSSFLILSILFQSIAGIFLLSYPVNTANAAYLALTPNSDLSIAGPYDVAIAGIGNWRIGTGNSSRDFITIGQKYRIRQNGTISQIKIHTVSTNSLAGFYLKIWRKNGVNYDLVGVSDNLLSELVEGDTTTIDLVSPILGVQEGDYYGYRLESSDDSSIYQFYARTGITGVTSYNVNNITPSNIGYDWTAQTAVNGSVLPIELYIQPPQVAFIGDSIIAGHPGHYSFLETTVTTNIASTIEGQFGNLTGYSYQNMGIGGQTTTQIAARFDSDIVALHPRAVVIEGGVNDIAGGSITKTTFLNNWTTMLDACRDNDIIPIVIPIMPWTNGNTTQMTTRDDWNVSLVALAQTYEDTIVADMSSAVGQYAADGPEGNLWDIKTAYNADGVHFNSTGHGAIAAVLADALEESIDYLTITGSASQTAGTTQVMTLRAINNFGDVYAGYTGDKTITLSGAETIGGYVPTFTDKDSAEVNFGTSGVITFANGVATTTVRLYKAGTAEIEATDGTYATGGSSSYDLDVVITAGAVAEFDILPPANAVSGTPFEVTLTAEDAYGNTTTDISGDVSLAVDYGTLNISSLANTQFTDDGIHSGNIIISGISQDRNVILSARNGAVESTANIAVTGVSGAPFLPPVKSSLSDLTITFLDNGSLSLDNFPAAITQIAVSTSPDFTDTSWEDITEKDELLKQYSDADKLYIKFRTANGGVSDVIIKEGNSINIGNEEGMVHDDIDDGNIDTASSGQVLRDGDIVKTPDSPDVYILKYKNGKKYKRLIISPPIFGFYHHLNWEEIKTVSREQLEQFTTSNLVKETLDSIIYRLLLNGDTGKKEPLDTSISYDPDSIYEINKQDRDSYGWEE